MSRLKMEYEGRLRHRCPVSRLARCQDSIADGLRDQSTAKIRLVGLLLFEVCEEIGNVMHEAVFVTDAQTGYPPVAHVGHVALGDVDRTPAAYAGIVVHGRSIPAGSDRAGPSESKLARR